MPERARGAQLCDLHEQVHADAEEEAQPRSEIVDVQAISLRSADIFHAVGERVSELLHRRRSGLVHVIAGDGDAVELRHLCSAVSDDVADDPHARLGRVDVGVADRELFQDVVLDRAGELRVRYALLLAGNDEEGHDRQHRAVHRHADRHLIEWDSVEQQFHILDRVDRHARHSDVTGDARIVAVVATVGGEVEGDAQPLLPRREIAAIEGVGFLGRREAGVLADGPGPTGVHRRIRPTGERSDAGVTAVYAFRVFGIVHRAEANFLNSLTRQIAAARLLLVQLLPTGSRRLIGHCAAP